MQTSVTSGTIFHGTHLPLVCWFWIIYHVAVDKGGTSATRLESQLGRPYKTITEVLMMVEAERFHAGNVIMNAV
jgi:hypothetical protein